MPFPQSIIDQAFAHAAGRCDCKREHAEADAPHKEGWCKQTFTRPGGAWQAHHITAESDGGENVLANCEILCNECYRICTGENGRLG